jgi:hypothetical protein
VARQITVLPPPAPLPDMLYVETDGTGVPVRASETGGRVGKDGDGQAGTREVKLARLFTVSRLDEQGRTVMDPGSSSYAFTFDGKDARARLAKAEYLRRGGEHSRQVVTIGDGAAWMWTTAKDLYRRATHITDIYHAREHLTDLAARLAFITTDPAQWLEDRSAELDAGNISAIIDAARQYPVDGIKAIVVQRAKQSGMHWTVDAAADILSLRCQRASGRWNDFVAPGAPGTGPRLRAAVPYDRATRAL